MDNQRQLAWQYIEQLASDLEGLAQAGEWEQFVEQYPQWDALLRQYFSAPVADEAEAAFLHEALPVMLARNEAMLVLCSQAKNEAARELGKVNLGRKAEAAYSRFGG